MTTDIKTIAVFLPLLASVFYGVTYTANGKVLGAVSLPTYLIIYCVTGLVWAGCLHVFSLAKIDFSALTANSMFVYTAISVVSSLAGWSLILVTIPQTSPFYTSAAEISYPFFVALFSYWIFRKPVDWHTALGGLLIAAGSITVIAGQLKAKG